MILDGKMDDVNEGDFYMKGSITEISNQGTKKDKK
jgi:F0F1-type ATP synthase beta subunit